MGATQRRFTYKCEDGHLNHRDHPLGARYDEHDHIFCPDCSRGEATALAYLIAVEIVEAKDSGHAQRSA
jgi:hypothetical protein